MRRIVALAVLMIGACGSAYPGARMLEQVAQEKLMTATHPVFDSSEIVLSAHCIEDPSGDWMSDGTVVKLVAEDLPLDPWLRDLVDYYASLARADGWVEIVRAEFEDLSEVAQGAEVLTARRVIDGVPMWLRLRVSIHHIERQTYRFRLAAGVDDGTFCTPG